ncbi:MAG: dihydropteroate synthase [Candidatus Coproplasma sp.]
MKIGNKIFENYTYVMAIINLTPDSFWQESRKSGDEVLFAVDRAIKDGAAIIDIGAQSTRPGYIEIPAEQEIERFERPLSLIKRNFDIPVSVDTYFSKSAEAALSIGADMINDVWGLAHDSDMTQIIASHGASVCIMHNSKSKLEGSVIGPVKDFLKAQAKFAVEAGISPDKICLDGGVGFAKDREQNWELVDNYEQLLSLGYPLLLGTSRKSMYGGRAEDRLAPTVRTTEEAARKNILFVRVHDVKENFDAIERVYRERN